MKGFLGTRGDFFSDLLILALVVILPALITAIVFAVKKRYLLHKRMMLAIFTVLVLYVIVYETNLTILGGVNYLTTNTRVPLAPYMSLVVFHIVQSALALILGGATISRGRAALSSGQVSREGFVSVHRKIAWVEVAMLVISAVTGLVIYYLTFIY